MQLAQCIKHLLKIVKTFHSSTALIFPRSTLTVTDTLKDEAYLKEIINQLNYLQLIVR